MENTTLPNGNLIGYRLNFEKKESENFINGINFHRFKYIDDNFSKSRNSQLTNIWKYIN
ncbi:hypothetical protein [Candidatus Harpocratesius sp.]